MGTADILGIGSVLSALIGGLTGDKGKMGSTYDRQQKKSIHDALDDVRSMRRQGTQDVTQNQNYMQGQDWLSNLFNDEGFFKAFEAPLQRQFQENTVPELANRFASMGSGGSLGSTAFRNQLAREGSNLHTNIAAMRGGMQQQGVNQGLQYAQQPFNNMMQLLGTGLTPTKNTYTPANTGLFGGLAAPLAQGAASIWGQQAGQQAGMDGNSYNPWNQSNPWSSLASMAAGQYPSTYP